MAEVTRPAPVPARVRVTGVVKKSEPNTQAQSAQSK